jgi:HSP20 family protein
MTLNSQLERRPTTPRLLDWLENEFSLFPGLRAFDRDQAIRCEEFVEDGKYVLRAELPGIDPEKDVEVSLADGVLTVAAERRESRKEQKRSEFCYGSLRRSLTLPKGADDDSVTATYRDGILQVTVSLPTKEETQAKKIPVAHTE